MVKDIFRLFFKEFFGFVATLLYSMIVFIFALQIIVNKFSVVVNSLKANGVFDNIETTFYSIAKLDVISVYDGFGDILISLSQIRAKYLVFPLLCLLLSFLLVRVIFYLIEYCNIYRHTTLNDRDINFVDVSKFLCQQLLQTIVSTFFMFLVIVCCYYFAGFLIEKGFPNAVIAVCLLVLLTLIIFIKNLFNISWGFSIICNKDSGLRDIVGFNNGIRKINSSSIKDNLIITLFEVVAMFGLISTLKFVGLLLGFVICILMNVCQNVINYYKIKKIKFIK